MVNQYLHTSRIIFYFHLIATAMIFHTPAIRTMSKQRIHSLSSTMAAPSFWIVVLLASSFLFRLTISADQQCISNINDIYDTEKDITNTSIERIYVLCPNRRYKIGYLDFYSQNLRGGDKDKQQPIPLRPNMKIQCGDVGSSRSCFIESGDLQVDGTAMRGLRDNNLDNVEIVGFIFEGAMKNSFWTTKPGSITFRNCEWTVRSNSIINTSISIRIASATNDYVRRNTYR
jgi:hypothetical protein